MQDERRNNLLAETQILKNEDMKIFENFYVKLDYAT